MLSKPTSKQEYWNYLLSAILKELCYFFVCFPVILVLLFMLFTRGKCENIKGVNAVPTSAYD